VPTASGSSEREGRIVQRSTTLLSRLLEMSESVFFSNKSLIVLIEALSARLAAAVARGEEEELLEFWEAQLPAFSKRLLALAREDELALPDGTTRPFMGERKTDLVLDECPPGPDAVRAPARVSVRG